MERIARLIRELDMEAATPAEVRDTFGYRGRVPSGPSSRRVKTSNSENLLPGHPTLNQQLFVVVQAQLKAKIPAYSPTDDGSRKAVAMIKAI